MSTDGIRFSDGTVKWLKNFLVDWYGGRSPGYGSPDADLPASLPAALRDLYALAGRWPCRDPEEHLPASPMILQHQDVLVRAADLSVNGGAIDFLRENQDSWTCRVAAGTDTSAVFSNAHWMWDDVDMDDYVALAPTLEHFLTSFVLQETVMGCRNLVVAEDETALAASGLPDRATPLWLQGWYVFDEPTHSFWRSGPFLLAEITGTHWVGWNDVAAQLPAAASDWRRIRTDGM